MMSEQDLQDEIKDHRDEIIMLQQRTKAQAHAFTRLEDRVNRLESKERQQVVEVN